MKKFISNLSIKGKLLLVKEQNKISMKTTLQTDCREDNFHN